MLEELADGLAAPPDELLDAAGVCTCQFEPTPPWACVLVATLRRLNHSEGSPIQVLRTLSRKGRDRSTQEHCPLSQ